MTREELKRIIIAVMVELSENKAGEAPRTGCAFLDNQPDPCDVTSRYAVGEEG